MINYSKQLCLLLLCQGFAVYASNVAYVADGNSSTVYVVDVATNAVTQTVTNASGTPFSQPSAVAVNPDMRSVYMADLAGSPGVFLIDIATNTATQTIVNASSSAFSLPIGISFSPNGDFAYVADATPAGVFLVNTTTNTATQTIANTSGSAFSSPQAVAISPDGSFAYVTEVVVPTVFLVNTTTNTATQKVTNTSGTPFNLPRGVAISPDGSFAYVADSGAPAIFVIDATHTATQKVTNTSGTPFNFPTAVAISPDGSFAYVGDAVAAAVFVVNTATHNATQTVANISGTPFNSPIGLAISSDGTIAYAGDDGALAVFVIDTATHTATQTVANASGIAFNQPTAIAFASVSSGQISTVGLKGNNLALANYLNANAPSSVINLFSSLQGGDLRRALESAAPTRNAFATFASQIAPLSLVQLATENQRQKRFHNTMKTVAKKKITDGDKDEFDPEELLVGLSWKGRKKAKQKTICTCEPHTFWLGTFGEYAREKPQSQVPGFSAGSGGAIAAFDFNWNNGSTIGTGAAYAYTHIHEKKDAGHANVNQGLLTVYGTAVAGKWYFDMGVWGGYYHIDNIRKISFSDVSERAKSNTHGWQLIPHLEIGYNTSYLPNNCVEWFGVEPFVMADWVNCWERKLQEHGAGDLNMGQKGRHSSMVRAESGVRFYETAKFGWGELVFSEKGSYAYQKTFHTGHITAFLVGSPGSFTVSTLVGAQNLGVGEFSMLVVPNNPKAPYVNISYQGEFGSKYQSHQGLLTIGKDF